MMKVELSREELALESVELLPDRDTMQTFLGSSAVQASNSADVTQSNGADVTTGVGDADVTQSNSSEITNTNTVDSSGEFNLTLNL